MKFSTLLRWAVAGVLLVVVVRATVTGRNRSEDAAPPVPESGQEIVLQGANGEVPFAVERLNVYLTEDDQYPESFEFEGKDISLVGLIPTALHVGYDEDWSVLVGHPIAFSRNINDNSADSGSHIRIPGESLTPVVGGEFTIQQVGEGSDAKTPLIGEIRLKCLTPAGEREYRGTFKVKGTTWG